jgi:transcriptional regulator with XRE-family HTH domain
MPEHRSKSIHEDAYQVLVDCLRRARLRAGLTQSDLASKLGSAQPYVSKYERSERRLDILEAREICIALGLPFREFIDQFEAALQEHRK